MGCPQIATADFDLNAATVGIPCFLSGDSPKSGSLSIAREKPVELPTGKQTSISFRASSEFDYVVLGHSLMLWKLASNVLTYVPPHPSSLGGTVPANVRLNISDSGGRRYLTDYGVHWAELASLAGRPWRWPSPWILEAGSTFTVQAHNYEQATTFALSMHLVCLKIRRGAFAKSELGRVNFDKMWREASRQGSLPTGDPRQNLATCGLPAVLTDPQGRATLATGTYAAPSVEQTRVISTTARAPLWIEQIMASIMVDGDTIRNDGLTLPIFARITDDRQNAAITDGWIPLGCLAGTAEWPMTLPQPWVGVEAGAFTVELRSMYATQTYVDLSFGGVYRTRGEF